YPWNDNMLQPCPMLENPQILPEMVHAADAKNTDYTAQESADQLCARTTPYSKEWAPEARKLWLEEHPTGKKVYDHKLSTATVEEKRALMEAEETDPDKAYVSVEDGD
ncbi:MAG: pyrroloquinoline quinone biosynthesis protein PqqE, partial [Olegusella sp.]|nr:pyrroloquinoline quinone biosynthesis protein PqqE [Olegusella sp.]